MRHSVRVRSDDSSSEHGDPVVANPIEAESLADHAIPGPSDSQKPSEEMWLLGHETR